MSEEPTTPDLVELTRRQFEFADRADWDAILETYARDAVWEVRGGGTFEGAAAIRELWADYFSAYKEFEIETEEILDFGNGVILAVNQQIARLVGSASHIETREAFVYTWVGGVVVRVTMYRDIDEARAAAERLAEERGRAMPDESTTPDLAAARRSAEAFDRRDFDAALAVLGPDPVWDFSSIGMGVFEGCEAIRGFCEDWLGTYEDYEQVTEELRDLGNGVTFGVSHQGGRPRGSSGLVALRYAGVGTWRDGLLERLTLYLDIDEARAVAERLAEERG